MGLQMSIILDMGFSMRVVLGALNKLSNIGYGIEYEDHQRVMSGQRSTS